MKRVLPASASMSGKVPGNPPLRRTVKGRLYPKIRGAVGEYPDEDLTGNIATTDDNRGMADPMPASAITIAFFTSSAAMVN